MVCACACRAADTVLGRGHSRLKELAQLLGEALEGHQGTLRGGGHGRGAGLAAEGVRHTEPSRGAQAVEGFVKPCACAGDTDGPVCC